MGYRKYKLDEDYFSKIDTEDKAYFLGLLYADGYNCENDNAGRHIDLTVQKRDRQILYDFKKYLKSSAKIVILNKKKESHQDGYKLQLNSIKTSKYLHMLGCVQNKTFKIQFPSFEIVPRFLIRHFIRGYFDGDGCIWEGKRKIMNVKDDHKPGQRRNKIIHNTNFSINGNIIFLIQLQKHLMNELGFKKIKIYLTKRNDKIGVFQYAGRKQIEIFYNYLYLNSIVFMDRKKKKFEKIINWTKPYRTRKQRNMSII